MKVFLILCFSIFISFSLFAEHQIVKVHLETELYRNYLDDGESFEYEICSFGASFYSTHIGLIPVKRRPLFGKYKKELINCSNVMPSGKSFRYVEVRKKVLEAQRIVSISHHYKLKNVFASLFLPKRTLPFKPGLSRIVHVEYNKDSQEPTLPNGRNKEVLYSDFVNALQILRNGTVDDLVNKLEWTRK